MIILYLHRVFQSGIKLAAFKISPVKNLPSGPTLKLGHFSSLFRQADGFQSRENIHGDSTMIHSIRQRQTIFGRNEEITDFTKVQNIIIITKEKLIV